MLAEIIRKLTKCEENVTIPSETVLAWAKRVEAQRAQTAVISRLHELKNFDTITHKENKTQGQKHASHTKITRERDANTADKSINKDDAQCMVKGAINMARPITLKWYAEGPRAMQSILW